MITDYHSHILPGVDDGAKSFDESIEMLKLLAEQGVERQFATPHFYCHREKSVNDFLDKCKVAFRKIQNQEYIKKIKLGAEVSLEIGISECENIDKLAVKGTRLILLEPSYFGFYDTMIEDIYNISSDYDLKPVIAHIHRYVGLYTKEQLQKLLNLNAVFQINADAFLNRKEKKLANEIIKSGKEFVFGTDSHNINTRKPNFDLLHKELKKSDILEKSNSIYEKYKIN